MIGISATVANGDWNGIIDTRSVSVITDVIATQMLHSAVVVVCGRRDRSCQTLVKER